MTTPADKASAYAETFGIPALDCGCDVYSARIEAYLRGFADAREGAREVWVVESVYNGQVLSVDLTEREANIELALYAHPKRVGIRRALLLVEPDDESERG